MRADRARLAGAWFQIVIGLAVVVWWGVAAASGNVDELGEGRVDIVFHIAAELIMAALLIAGGSLLLGAKPSSKLVSGLALGALLYSSINSPGYFAERGEWSVVIMFAVIGTAAIGTVRIVGSHRVQSHPQPEPTPAHGVRSRSMSHTNSEKETSAGTR